MHLLLIAPAYISTYDADAVSNCFIFSLQVKNKPYDKIAICVFILRAGVITNNTVYKTSLHSRVLQVHLHEIFDISFFSSKASSWAPDQAPKLFSNINSNSPRRSFRVLSEYAEKNYFVMLGLNNQSFLIALRFTCTHTYFFLSSIPLNAVMKMIGFQTFKIIWGHSPNTRNESFHILRIRGMNLFGYWEYAERIFMYSENTRNEANIGTKFGCSYTENTRNESVRILRIRRMNLFVYWEYAEWICTYTENTRNAWKFEYLGEFETKIENILGCSSGA